MFKPREIQDFMQFGHLLLHFLVKHQMMHHMHWWTQARGQAIDVFGASILKKHCKSGLFDAPMVDKTGSALYCALSVK